MRYVCTSIVAALMLAGTGIAWADDAVQWTEAEGGNGHWYELHDTTGTSWNDHRQTALAVGGDLACPIDENTNTFLADLMLASPLCGDVTYISIGGLQSQGEDEPDGGWQWVSGAEWSWTNWSSDEPNDAWDGEWALVYNSSPTCGDLWNDVNPTLDELNRGYIIEWSADCNGDGIVDYGQILDGSLADDNGNGVPDCCDDTSCLAGVQWKVEDGGNGHWYDVALTGENITWTSAMDETLSKGGHLVTLTSSAENDFVHELTRNSIPDWTAYGPWIGGFQDLDSPDYSEPGGAWTWVTGEAWGFTAWNTIEPNDGNGGTEHWLQMTAHPFNTTWNDAPDDMPDGVFSYVIEWSADCNGDGIVDYGQILDGSLADDNGNGIPDICQQVDMGACCLAGTCVMTTVTYCFEALGSYAGDGISCADAGCPAPCPGDIDGDGQIGIVELLVVIDRWGFCP